MKKNILKFGAALTAALMMFSATAMMAYATDVEEVEAPVEVVEEVEAPEEVQVPLEMTEITPEEMAEIELAAQTGDVDTGSVITISNITATKTENYYNVSVPFTVEVAAPSQMTFFVYDISAAAGDQNNEVVFSSTTPVGYINQYGGEATGTYDFKLSTANYTDDSIIVVKIGGTDVAMPDAKSFKLATEASEFDYGDVDHSGVVNAVDASLVMRYYIGTVAEDSLDLDLADAYDAGDDVINAIDASSIMRFYRGTVDSLPITK